ncbi:hypothetical protein [Mycobacterium tuberculosis]|uniref:hypothetical protein n=1 Tax=Mycobacterium tuberculosis TaxID=1773 RepID=UPI00350EAF29
MRVALELVRDGKAQACVSAGNTGALMALSRHVLKTLPGIDRPAMVAAIPTPMRVALELVRDGKAQACVSAGNTGALMALSRHVPKPRARGRPGSTSSIWAWSRPSSATRSARRAGSTRTQPQGRMDRAPSSCSASKPRARGRPGSTSSIWAWSRPSSATRSARRAGSTKLKSTLISG